MNVEAVSSPPGLSNIASGTNVSSLGDKNALDNFSGLMRDAIDSINTTQKSADKEISRAVTGESPDLHRTIIELQTADLKFQFGLQVRNKLIGAYEEIMRMQV